jgi:Cu-Zn family superoxide dismutase
MRVLIVLFACACATSSGSTPAKSSATTAASSAISNASGPAAVATIEPRSGSTVSGTAKFVPAADGLGAHVEVQGATPGLHGVHIHEKGDCSDPKAASAGAHFNPNGGAHHGGPEQPPRHGGDLGNIEVDSGGKGTLDVVVKGLSVASLENGVVGRAIVVHEKVDDLTTDPAGNSGARVGCGTIQAPPIGG